MEYDPLHKAAIFAVGRDKSDGCSSLGTTASGGLLGTV